MIYLLQEIPIKMILMHELKISKGVLRNKGHERAQVKIREFLFLMLWSKSPHILQSPHCSTSKKSRPRLCLRQHHKRLFSIHNSFVLLYFILHPFCLGLSYLLSSEISPKILLLANASNKSKTYSTFYSIKNRKTTLMLLRPVPSSLYGC